MTDAIEINYASGPAALFHKAATEQTYELPCQYCAMGDDTPHTFERSEKLDEVYRCVYCGETYRVRVR